MKEYDKSKDLQNCMACASYCEFNVTCSDLVGAFRHEPGHVGKGQTLEDPVYIDFLPT